MLEQAAHIAESFRKNALGETVIPTSGADVFRNASEQIHVLSEADRDVRFQNFENAPFALAGVGIYPGESNHCADAGFEENSGPDLDRIRFELRSQLADDDPANIYRIHIGDSVLKFGQGAAQLRKQMGV